MEPLSFGQTIWSLDDVPLEEMDESFDSSKLLNQPSELQPLTDWTECEDRDLVYYKTTYNFSYQELADKLGSTRTAKEYEQRMNELFCDESLDITTFDDLLKRGPYTKIPLRDLGKWARYKYIGGIRKSWLDWEKWPELDEQLVKLKAIQGMSFDNIAQILGTRRDDCSSHYDLIKITQNKRYEAIVSAARAEVAASYQRMVVTPEEEWDTVEEIGSSLDPSCT